MQDFEVRDVMGRGRHPRIVLDFEFEIKKRQYIEDGVVVSESSPEKTLTIYAKNEGPIYAKYVVGFINIPVILLHKDEVRYREKLEKDGQAYCLFVGENTVRDLLDVEFGVGGARNKYGPSRFDPILPSLRTKIETVKLDDNFESLIDNDVIVEWQVNADNAQPKKGTIFVKDISVLHQKDSIAD